jgi:hypothetical protein
MSNLFETVVVISPSFYCDVGAFQLPVEPWDKDAYVQYSAPALSTPTPP